MKIPLANAEIVFNDDIFFAIKSILTEAEPAEEVYVVSPYIKFDTRIKEAIEEARSKRVEVIVILREDTEHPIDDIQWLLKERVVIKRVATLHAKIYSSKSAAMIASMNLHSFSGRESKECGVFTTDPVAIVKLREQIEKWLKIASDIDLLSVTTKKEQPGTVVASKIEERKPTTTQRPVGTAVQVPKGFCIRCGKSKTYNAKYPLCDDCYDIWAQYKNKEFPEKLCHRCGKPHETTVSHPLCKPCWTEDNRKTA